MNHGPDSTRATSAEWQDGKAVRRKGLDRKQVELAALERDSTEFRYFLPTMITGLLATPAYVRASVASFAGDHSKIIAKKLERQAVLRDTAKHFTFVLTEQACRWPLLPAGDMAAQLDHLASVSRMPNVRLGVIPMEGHLPRAPLNVFTVYDETLATVEVTTGALVFRDPDDIQEYLNDFRTFEGYSLWGEDARIKLTEWTG
ncbi:DUF5753 domain-containing protein [Streptomyces rubellomurinus]|uniref:DUF5753 domain-containing protein n=1 Tax=Streptomyces sp. Y1 TaxID=3238634 RepID=A0AB39TKQ0_9ACTN|nr:regulatory protein [Streptomyces rubellomurinus subsp. indigoferus]